MGGRGTAREGTGREGVGRGEAEREEGVKGVGGKGWPVMKNMHGGMREFIRLMFGAWDTTACTDECN